MKRIILFTLLLFSSIFAISQQIIEGDSLVIYGGGNFEDEVQGVVATDLNSFPTLQQLNDSLAANAFVVPIDSLPFNQNADVTYFTAYTFKPDTANRTVSMTNDESEIKMQLGQELWLEIKNDNGTTFNNGVFVYITGSAEGHPTVMLAHNRDFETIDAIGMITHDVEAGTFGFTTTFGSVGGLVTTGETAGDRVYVDTLSGGKNWTTTIPVFPKGIYDMGFIQVVDGTDGKIFINPRGRVDDILDNQNNANIIENFSLTVTSNGTVVTGTLESTDGKDYLTVRWSTGFSKITVPATVTISPGTDNNAQTNYLYIPKSSETLTSSTSYFPIGTEYKTIAKVKLWSAAKTLTSGAKGNQNYNDYIASISSLRGRIAQIGNWMRLRALKYISGSKATLTVVTQGAAKDDVYLAVPQGNWSQANEQVLAAMDMQTGDDIHVPNYPSHTDTTISNLNELLIDATGSSLSGRSFTYVFYIAQNKTGEESHMYVNLPNGSYSSGAAAEADESGYKVTDIPYDEESFSGYVLEAVITHTTPSSGTWTVYSTTDITGKSVGYSGGGSGGGVSATTFDALTDTPASKAGEGGSFVTVHSGETDLEYTAKADVNVGDLNDDGTYQTILTNPVTGGGDGVTNTLTKFNGINSVTNSGITENGTTVDFGALDLTTTGDVSIAVGSQFKLGSPAEISTGLVMPSTSAFVFSDALTITSESASNIINNFNNNVAILLQRVSTGSGSFLKGRDNLGIDQFKIDADGDFTGKSYKTYSATGILLSTASDFYNSSLNPSIWSADGGTGLFTGQSGHLILEPRAHVARYIILGAGTPMAEVMRIKGTGVDITGDLGVTGTVTHAAPTLSTQSALLSDVQTAVSGTDGFIPNFDGTDALEDSPIYTDGTNVGIGTASPNYKLDVKGVINIDSGNGYSKGGTIILDATNSNNLIVGLDAGVSITTGDGNTFIGHQSGQAVTESSSNTFVGDRSGFSNTTGIKNVFIGQITGYDNTLGSTNMFIGTNSGRFNTEGSNNTYIGDNVGRYNVLGNDNVFIGYQAGEGVTANSNSNNVFIGHQAGDNVSTGSNNIAIGYDVDILTATSSNYLNIGNTIYGDLSSGNVGIGLTDPDVRLEILNAGNQLKLSFDGTDNAIFAVDTNGDLTITNSGTKTIFTDDIELNEDLIDINGSEGTAGQILSSLGAGNGTDWIDESGGATDHSALTNLDYASAGHTDFVSTTTSQSIGGAKTFTLITNFNSGAWIKNVIYNSEVAVPSTPGAGIGVWYVGTDGKFYGKNDGGTVYDLTGTGGVSAINDLSDAITNSSSVFLGSTSGSANTGGGNTGVGIGALRFNVGGINNTAIGHNAARDGNNIATSYNTSVGEQSMVYNQTGLANTALGYGSLLGVSTSSNISSNTAIGYLSLSSILTDGDNNIALGYQSGNNITTGANNIIIGYDIDAQSATGSNTMTIGNLIFGTGLTSTGTTISTGSIGIGIASPDTRLDVNGATTGRELSSDPSDPDEGSYVIWMSDGTGAGDDGDIMMKITAGATTKTTTLVDFSTL